MPEVFLQLNEAQYALMRSLLVNVPKKFPDAMRNALNRTVDTGATRIRKAMSIISGIPVRKIGKRVKGVHANYRQSFALIRLFNYNFKMIDTKEVPVIGGRYPLAKEDDSWAIRHNPFKQVMLSKHEGWFVRHGTPRVMEKGRYIGKVRQPIKQIWARSPRKLWEEAPGLAEDQLSQLGPILTKNILSQIDRFTK